MQTVSGGVGQGDNAAVRAALAAASPGQRSNRQNVPPQPLAQTTPSYAMNNESNLTESPRVPVGKFWAEREEISQSATDYGAPSEQGALASGLDSFFADFF